MESSVLASLSFFSSGVINKCFSKSGIVPKVNNSSIIILNKGANIDAIYLVIDSG